MDFTDSYTGYSDFSAEMTTALVPGQKVKMISLLLFYDATTRSYCMPRDTDIIALLDRRTVIRRRDLIRHLMETHRGESGYGKQEVDRRITALVEDGRIVTVPDRELAAFGISDTGKNASYVISRQSFERKWQFDRMITEIPSLSGDDSAAALHEVLLHKSVYRLTPAQLDMIVPTLDQEFRVAYLALQCLHSAAVRKGDLPVDTAVLTQKLRHLLERFRDDETNRPAIRHAVHLLACLGDEAVIGQLAFDAYRFDGDGLRRGEYMYPVMVNVICSHRAELNELERTFQSRGDPGAARDIREIVKYALDPQEYERKMKKIQDEEVEIF